MKEGATRALSKSSRSLGAQLSKRSALHPRARAKEKVKRVSGLKILPREASGMAHRRDSMRRETASRGRSPTRHGGSLKSPRRKAKARAKVEERPKAREKASHATCAEGLGTPLTTWSRTRLKEKTPTKKAVGPRRTTRHSNWDTLAANLV